MAASAPAAPLAPPPVRPASGCVGGSGSGGGLSAASLARYAAARVGNGSDDPRDFMREPDYVATADVEDIYARWDAAVPPDVAEALEPWVLQLVAKAPANERELQACMAALRRATKRSPQKSALTSVYLAMVAAGRVAPQPQLRALLVKKSSKSQSGVLVITVLTSPFPEVDGVAQPFSCAWNCHYCPAEPGQPRSYLHDEPAVRRANQNAFDPVLQFTDRAATLLANGHPVDKIELLVLGGTWASYPHAYQEAFCRDLFYAANTFAARGAARRQRLSLAEEQAANEAAECKIIGLTLETRPDTINADELRRLRRYGCTRVQLGVQHTDDAVLRKVNRGCSTAATRRALRLLKDTCYKVDVHLMPNLPGATLEADEAMFTAMLDDPGLQADQWKIYPCEVLPWTKVKEWFDAGEFVPYADDALFELILRVKARMHPWIRLNRVIRDIPSQYILGGVDAPNMRQTLAEHLAARGLACPCIRCREVGADSDRKAGAARLRRRDYAASDGQEIFLSFETPDAATIFGFARLRLTSDPGSGVFPALRGAALIRELHVYGQLVPTAPAGGGAAAAQHTGFGRALMAAAEDIAAAAGATSVAVIAGIGARNYYRKLGYEVEDDGGFMIKAIPKHKRMLARVRLAAPRAAALLPFVPLLAALLLLVLHLMFPAAESDHGGLAEL